MGLQKTTDKKISFRETVYTPIFTSFLQILRENQKLIREARTTVKHKVLMQSQ